MPAERRGEVDAINGSIPRLGKECGVPTVVRIIKAREAGFRAWAPLWPFPVMR